MSPSPSPSLPPGQRVSAVFPRFGLTPYARRFPKEPSRAVIQVGGEVEEEIALSDPLEGLPRVEQVSDFHCVTTWSCLTLPWSGVRFADFFERVLEPRARPRPGASIVLLRGQDGYRTSLPLDDLLRPDVLLADRLAGEPLTIEHGAPLRLIAPAHYGYKNVKHLARIDFWHDLSRFRASAFRFMDHPRARVAQEERGQGFPGWMLRYLYRPLIGMTASRFAKAMEEHRRD
ncbi:MAG TPA: molybdopterin-dependent oxidoreductase [Thermoanaerobaculia bacterium]|nr:molybdopterin-dependent oxidoreductase [Thermoanaerobaculia bacterium]